MGANALGVTPGQKPGLSFGAGGIGNLGGKNPGGQSLKPGLGNAFGGTLGIENLTAQSPSLKIAAMVPGPASMQPAPSGPTSIPTPPPGPAQQPPMGQQPMPQPPGMPAAPAGQGQMQPPPPPMSPSTARKTRADQGRLGLARSTRKTRADTRSPRTCCQTTAASIARKTRADQGRLGLARNTRKTRADTRSPRTACSPASVYRVLKAAGLLAGQTPKTTKKGTGFVQPLKLAEVAALAWRWFCRLAHKGKDARQFPIVFARYVCRAVQQGRRLCGQPRVPDVLDPSAQYRHGFRVEPLPSSTRVDLDHLYGDVHRQGQLDVFEERLADNTVTPVPDQAAFRIDFPTWLATLTARERRLIRAMARNERTKDLSRQFQLSPGRISQLRRDFHQDWTRFCGDAPPA
jgi:hypothetical protein